MEIKYTCSLGPLCHSASILKLNNIKLCSYPFDWVFSSTFIILDCLNDDFKTFLDKKYYCDVTTKWNKRQCGHTKYDLNMFNHKDPRTEEDYEYYKRCVDRFRSLIKNTDSKLFIKILINLNEKDINDIKKSNIKFNNDFSKYTNNYILLIILNISDKKTNYHCFTYENNIHFLELHTISKSNGNTFLNNNDNQYLNNIIKNNYIISNYNGNI